MLEPTGDSHRHQRQHLQQMVLRRHAGTDGVVKLAAVLHPRSRLHGDVDLEMLLRS